MGNATRQLGEPLFELLAVVVGGRGFDLAPNLSHAALDVGSRAGAFDDGSLVLVHDDLLRPAEVLDLNARDLDAEVLEDGLATGKDRDVLEHGLAAVTEARRLDRTTLEGPAQTVDHERGERFAFDVLGHDHERLPGFGDLLEERNQVLDRGDLLLVNEDVGILQNRFHAVRLVDEMGRAVALVELHPFHPVGRGLEALAFLDRDDAVLADLLHRVSDHLADLGVTVCGDRPDLRNLLLAFDRRTAATNLSDDGFDGLVNTPLQIDGIGASGHVLQALFVDRFGQNRGGRGPITSNVAGLRGHFLHHLGPHVLILVFQFDLFCDGHSIFGDCRGAKTLLDNHVAPTGTEGHFHRSGKLLHAIAGVLSGLHIK